MEIGFTSAISPGIGLSTARAKLWCFGFVMELAHAPGIQLARRILISRGGRLPNLRQPLRATIRFWRFASRLRWQALPIRAATPPPPPTTTRGTAPRSSRRSPGPVSYTHLRAHETPEHLV